MSTITEPTATVVSPGESWSLDPIHSSIGFSVLYMGVVPFDGAFREVTATLDRTGLRGTALATSVDVDDANLAAHLASPDFFDAERHPELGFSSGPLVVDGDRVTVDGVLEIKGNRVEVPLVGTITSPVGDPWGNRKLGLTLAGSVDRSAVGLTWNAPLPEGGEMLGEQVELTARLVFVASPQES
ncbi:MAG: YceI family protein [Gaiella sp.]